MYHNLGTANGCICIINILRSRFMNRDLNKDDAREPIVCVQLTLEDVAWIAGVAASVVRNNCVVPAPRDWRQIPMWWKAVGEVCVGLSVVEDEVMVQDSVRAVGVLRRLSSVPRPCCLGPHG